MFKKYNSDIISKLIYFFIARKKINFSYCSYINKHDKELCNCKIKVKNIVNLSIESFIFILTQHTKNNHNNNNNNNNDNNNAYKFINENSSNINTINTNNIHNVVDSVGKKNFTSKYNSEKCNDFTNETKSNKNIVKIKKNKNSENILKCFNNLEKANDVLGCKSIENHYTLDSNSYSELNNSNIFVDDKNINKLNLIKNTNNTNDTHIFNCLDSYDLDNTNNLDKYFNNYKYSNSNKQNLKNFYNSQFSSESIDSTHNLDKENKDLKVSKKNKSTSQNKQKKTNNINENIMVKNDLSYEPVSNILQKDYIDNISSNSKESNSNNLKKIPEKSESSSDKSKSSSDKSKSSSEKSKSSSDKSDNLSDKSKSSSDKSKSSSEKSENSSDKSKSSSERIENSSSDIIKIYEALDSETCLNLKNKKGKDNIKIYIDLIINYLKINNNILIDEKCDIGKLAIELKKIIKNKYPNETASKFDRLYQKIILVKTISDTDEMNNYYDLINQLNEYKKLL
jgi:hypothetical protein